MKPKKLKSILFLSLIIVSANLILSEAKAQIVSYGSETSAQGGAGAGSFSASDSALQNPAALPFYFSKAASIGAGFRSEHLFFVDNGVDAMFPAQLGYYRSDLYGLKTQNFAVGSAWRLSKHISLGFNLGWVNTKYTPTGNKYNYNNLDLGLAFVPIQKLSLGFIFKNMALKNTGLDDFYDHNPEYGAGFEYKIKSILNFKFDTTFAKNQNKDQKSIVKTGVEFYLQDWFFLRLGYQNNNVLENNYLTAGFGLGGSPFGLHYSYIKEAKNEKEDYHSIDLAFPF